MPANHSTGLAQGTRQGNVPVEHTFRLAPGGALNRKWLRVSASVSKPTLVSFKEVGGNVAATGGTYALGTASGGAQLVAARALPGLNAPPAVPVALVSVFTADFDIWINLTSATTAGAAYLIATLTELNVADVNPNAIP